MSEVWAKLMCLGSVGFRFIACAWLRGGLERRIEQIWDVRKRVTCRDCTARNSDGMILAFCWFPESSGLVSIKICLTRYGCKLMTFFHLLRFYTSFFTQKRPRDIRAQIVVEKLHISKSNFFTKFKSLPVFNTHLLAFHVHKLSVHMEFIFVPATGTYPPTPIPGIPYCHPVSRTATPRHACISFGPASRQIRHANIRLCTVWRLKLQMYWEKHSRNLVLYMD